MFQKVPNTESQSRSTGVPQEKMLFGSTDLYAEQWAKWEQVNLKLLSEWKDQVKELAVDHISDLKGNLNHQNAKFLTNLMSKAPWRNFMLILF